MFLMQASGRQVAVSALDSKLAQFDLQFLKNDLQKIPDIQTLAGGVFGTSLLAGLAMLRLEGRTDPYLRNVAIIVFSKFSAIRKDFIQKYDELSKKKDFTMVNFTNLQIAAEAFYYAMGKAKITHNPENNSARGLANNKIDCDISTYLFIQLGREKGLELVKVGLRDPNSEPGHVVAAEMKNGKIINYVETTRAYAGAARQYIDNISNKVTKMKTRIKTSNTGVAVSNINPNQKRQAQGIASINEIKIGFIVVPSNVWENNKDNKEYKIKSSNRMNGPWSGAETYISSLVDYWAKKKNFGSDKNNGIFNFRTDKKLYNKILEAAKSNWKEEKSAENFSYYYALLRHGAITPMLFGIDNEKELFSAWDEGVKVFGKEELKQMGLTPPVFIQKILNPVDWFMSKKK